MRQRQAVTATIAVRYRRASKAEKGRILDELCAVTGWHPQPRPQGPRRQAEDRAGAPPSPA